MMDTVNVKSVRYPVATDEKLEKISLKLGRPKKLVVIQMVDYFYKSKKDPLDLNDELLKKELVNGNNRIISFIRKQESDFLFPTFNNTAGQITIAKEHTKYFKAIGEHLSRESTKSEKIVLHIQAIADSMKAQRAHLESKAQLKLMFKDILEHYFTQRESLGWPVSSSKKDALQTHCLNTLDNI